VNPVADVLLALVALLALGAGTWCFLPSERCGREHQGWAMRVPVPVLRAVTRRRRRAHERRHIPPDPGARKISDEEKAVLDALEGSSR
jgi:hypothetical protein